MILETSRLILRPFAESDLDRMGELMANEEFMRFSMGPMTRQQTAVFLGRMEERFRRMPTATSATPCSLTTPR